MLRTRGERIGNAIFLVAATFTLFARFTRTGRQARMACAGLLLAISVALGTATNLSEAVRENSPASAAPMASQSLPTIQNQAPRPANRVIDLSVAGALHNPAIPSVSEGTSPTAPNESRWENGETPGFSLGPVRTEFGGVSGRHMHLATIKLQGLSVFGGSVGASLDSRSARISLSWPTSP